MCFEAQKLRLVSAITAPWGEEERRKIAYSSEHMTPFQKWFVELSLSFSGFFNVMPYIRDAFSGPRFDQGYPELLPSFVQVESGEIILRGFPPAPPGVELPAAERPQAAE